MVSPGDAVSPPRRVGGKCTTVGRGSPDGNESSDSSGIRMFYGNRVNSLSAQHTTKRFARLGGVGTAGRPTKNDRQNPVDLWGWGAHKKGIWDANPRAIQALGLDPSEWAREPAVKPAGLMNLGATCYLNTTVQSLFFHRDVRSALFRWARDSLHDPDWWRQRGGAAEDPLWSARIQMHALVRTMGYLLLGNRSFFNPRMLIHTFKLDTMVHQDVTEFFKHVLNHLERVLGDHPEPAIANIVQDQFRGKQAYVMQCLTCRKASAHEAHFYELDVPIQGHDRLESALQAHLAVETMAGSNQYQCTQCAVPRDAARFLDVREVPPVLHLQLLRYVYDQRSGTKKKLRQAVRIPDVLDFRSILQEGRRHILPNPDLSTEAEASLQDMLQHHGGSVADPGVYELTTVFYHKGSAAHAGHYVLDAWDEERGQWWRLDDETVTAVTSPLGDGATQLDGANSVEQDEEAAAPPAKRQKKESNGDSTQKPVAALSQLKVLPSSEASAISSKRPTVTKTAAPSQSSASSASKGLKRPHPGSDDTGDPWWDVPSAEEKQGTAIPGTIAWTNGATPTIPVQPTSHSSWKEATERHRREIPPSILPQEEDVPSETAFAEGLPSEASLGSAAPASQTPTVPPSTSYRRESEWARRRRHPTLLSRGSRNAYLLVYRRMDPASADAWRQERDRRVAAAAGSQRSSEPVSQEQEDQGVIDLLDDDETKGGASTESHEALVPAEIALEHLPVPPPRAVPACPVGSSSMQPPDAIVGEILLANRTCVRGASLFWQERSRRWRRINARRALYDALWEDPQKGPDAVSGCSTDEQLLKRSARGKAKSSDPDLFVWVPAAWLRKWVLGEDVVEVAKKQNSQGVDVEVLDEDGDSDEGGEAKAGGSSASGDETGGEGEHKCSDQEQDGVGDQSATANQTQPSDLASLYEAASLVCLPGTNPMEEDPLSGVVTGVEQFSGPKAPFAEDIEMGPFLAEDGGLLPDAVPSLKCVSMHVFQCLRDPAMAIRAVKQAGDRALHRVTWKLDGPGKGSSAGKGRRANKPKQRTASSKANESKKPKAKDAKETKKQTTLSYPVSDDGDFEIDESDKFPSEGTRKSKRQYKGLSKKRWDDEWEFEEDEVVTLDQSEEEETREEPENSEVKPSPMESGSDDGAMDTKRSTAPSASAEEQTGDVDGVDAFVLEDFGPEVSADHNVTNRTFWSKAAVEEWQSRRRLQRAAAAADAELLKYLSAPVPGAKEADKAVDARKDAEKQSATGHREATPWYWVSRTFASSLRKVVEHRARLAKKRSNGEASEAQATLDALAVRHSVSFATDGKRANAVGRSDSVASGTSTGRDGAPPPLPDPNLNADIVTEFGGLMPTKRTRRLVSAHLWKLLVRRAVGLAWWQQHWVPLEEDTREAGGGSGSTKNESSSKWKSEDNVECLDDDDDDDEVSEALPVPPRSLAQAWTEVTEWDDEKVDAAVRQLKLEVHTFPWDAPPCEATREEESAARAEAAAEQEERRKEATASRALLSRRKGKPTIPLTHDHSLGPLPPGEYRLVPRAWTEAWRQYVANGDASDRPSNSPPPLLSFLSPSCRRLVERIQEDPSDAAAQEQLEQAPTLLLPTHTLLFLHAVAPLSLRLTRLIAENEEGGVVPEESEARGNGDEEDPLLPCAGVFGPTGSSGEPELVLGDAFHFAKAAHATREHAGACAMFDAELMSEDEYQTLLRMYQFPSVLPDLVPAEKAVSMEGEDCDAKQESGSSRTLKAHPSWSLTAPQVQVATEPTAAARGWCGHAYGHTSRFLHPNQDSGTEASAEVVAWRIVPPLCAPAIQSQLQWEDTQRAVFSAGVVYIREVGPGEPVPVEDTPLSVGLEEQAIGDAVVQKSGRPRRRTRRRQGKEEQERVPVVVDSSDTAMFVLLKYMEQTGNEMFGTLYYRGEPIGGTLEQHGVRAGSTLYLQSDGSSGFDPSMVAANAADAYERGFAGSAFLS